MSYTVKELREIPTERLIEEHDAQAAHTVVGVNYYLEELARREAHEQGERIKDLTQTVVNLTWVIAVLTAVNVVAVVVSLL